MRMHVYDESQGSKWAIQIQRAGPSADGSAIGVDRL